MESMELKEEFALLKALYDKIPPMTCLNRQECCLATRVRCYALEYQYIKTYINENFSTEQKKILEKRITRNRFMEAAYYQKKKWIPRTPCMFVDKNNKKCLIYPARPFLCRILGFQEGDCENVKVGENRNFDIKNIAVFTKQLEDISKSHISKYGGCNRNYDFLRNWLYIERFGVNSRLPLKKDKQFYGVDFNEFFVL